MKQNKQVLIIIDMQNGIVQNAFGLAAVVHNINQLISFSRKNSMPIFWIQHNDLQLIINSDSWEIIKELQPSNNEIKINKTHNDAFEGTDLLAKLNELKINEVIICGAQTDACIRATIHGAFARGFNTTLISDAHTTEDLTAYELPTPQSIIKLTNTYWSWQTGENKMASVITTEEFLKR